MSYWNYRIIKKEFPEHNENAYQIHEVYYGDDGKIEGWNTRSNIALWEHTGRVTRGYPVSIECFQKTYSERE